MAIIGFKEKVKIRSKLEFDKAIRLSFQDDGTYFYFNIPKYKKIRVTRQNAERLANWILAVLDKE